MTQTLETPALFDTSDLATTLAGWHGWATVVRHDPPTGTWILIALHDNTLGPAAGGTRMKTYPSLGAALTDAQRLAAGMTAKWAAIDIPFGGGKAVLAVPRPLEGEERRGLLRRYGRLVRSLSGAFNTGPDLGTTLDDMKVIAEEAGTAVRGIDPQTGELTDPGPYTARGVFASVHAAVAQVFGNRDLAGRSVLVEGVGSVGGPLAAQLAGAGARVLVADVSPEAAQRVAAAVGGEVVATEDVPGTACDVYAPCAVGATLHAGSIARLACRAIAGSANNQLAEPEDAERLHRRGILYAPDFIANGGGALAFGLMGQGASEAAIHARLDGIEGTLREIFTEAAQENESPLAAAHRKVERVLARGRA